MRLRTRILVFGSLLITLVGVISISAALLRYSIMLPNPVAFRTPERAPIVRILGRDGTVVAERGAAHDYIPLAELPRHVPEAVIAIEDRRFYQHWGVDPWGLARAVLTNLRSGRYAQGGSTLTQQLAKNLFLSSDRRLGRKIEELLLSLWLEVRLEKPEILEIYLNRVYFGAGAYGIEAAARRFFDKSARDLTLAEAAVLAGLLKAPSRLAPSAQPGYARARARVVLAQMHAAGFIDAAREAQASGSSVRFAAPPAEREGTGLEFAVDFVLERLPPLVGGGHREIVVETTIDSGLQRKAQGAVQHLIETEGERQLASQAAVVLLDLDGGIRAIVGGRSFAESQLNRALRALRQPGSAFKPFVYLAALEKGMAPSTTVLDMPLNIGGWSPRNDGGGHKGQVTLRQALAQSINTVAVRLQLEAGVAAVIAVARRLGIRSPLHEGPSLALGTAEVSLLELTGAYGAFATGGTNITPHMIRRVRAGNGKLLFQREAQEPARVIAPVQAAQMAEMLAATVTEGTARRAALPRHVSAGKTGTSQDYRDAWYVGFTGHLLAGVWVGNDSGLPMARVSGGSLPVRVWREVMVAAHERLEPAPLRALAVPIASTPAAAVMPSPPPLVSAAPFKLIDPLAVLRGLAREAPAEAAVAKVEPPNHTAAKQRGVASGKAGAAVVRQEPVGTGAADQRIDAEFLARALEGLETEAPPASVEVTNGLEPKRPAPLPGMMSLGAGGG